MVAVAEIVEAVPAALVVAEEVRGEEMAAGAAADTKTNSPRHSSDPAKARKGSVGLARGWVVLAMALAGLIGSDFARADCGASLELNSVGEERDVLADLFLQDRDRAEPGPAGRTQPRKLSANFVAGLLTCDAVLRRLSKGLLRLDDIAVVGRLDLSHEKILPRVECNRCAFEGISAFGSSWSGEVELNNVTATDHLDLSSSQFDSSLTFFNAILTRNINLNDSRIKGDVAVLGNSQLQSLNARSSVIEGSLRLSGVRVHGYVNAWGSNIGRDVLLEPFQERQTLIGTMPSRSETDISIDREVVLNLGSTHVGRRISIGRTGINGSIEMDAVRVGEDIWLRSCSAVSGPLNLIFARVGQNVDLSSTILDSADFTGARITGELRLGAPKGSLTSPIWNPRGELILRNVSVSSWTDATGNETARAEHCTNPPVAVAPWPGQIDVIGFDYRDIGGLGGDAERGRHRASWFCDWLRRQVPFSLEPYQRAADYLERVGLSDDADDVKYCGKLREIGETSSWISKSVLQLQRGFVGFGYRVERSLIWAAIFIAMGQQIFSRTPEARQYRMPIGLAYSVEMFIPGLALRDIHSKIDLKGWQRYYFYVHKSMGWILGSFVVASFLGLMGVG